MTFFFGPFYFASHLRDYTPYGGSLDNLSITQTFMPPQAYPVQQGYGQEPQSGI